MSELSASLAEAFVKEYIHVAIEITTRNTRNEILIVFEKFIIVNLKNNNLLEINTCVLDFSPEFLILYSLNIEKVQEM